jgi:uncharacterized damage-inducible protein DinB
MNYRKAISLGLSVAPITTGSHNEPLSISIMNSVTYYRRLFEYSAWANREAIASMKRAPEVPEKALERIAHTLAAGALWLDRILATEQRMSVWPELSLEQCENEAQRIESDWKRYMNILSESELRRPVTYTNTKGDEYTNTVAEILTHVLLHDAYHRGQVASDLRGAGAEPAMTDFIFAARTEKV